LDHSKVVLGRAEKSRSAKTKNNNTNNLKKNEKRLCVMDDLIWNFLVLVVVQLFSGRSFDEILRFSKE
jgi:hypothetical protein